MNNDRAWLEKLAERENNGIVSAGGALARSLEQESATSARYANREGDSEIATYETSPDSITVSFRDGSIYRYTIASAGPGNIQRMKELAVAGQGLSEFINSNVKNQYAAVLR
jgi:hypothetical protein